MISFFGSTVAWAAPTLAIVQLPRARAAIKRRPIIIRITKKSIAPFYLDSCFCFPLARIDLVEIFASASYLDYCDSPYLLLVTVAAPFCDVARFSAY